MKLYFRWCGIALAFGLSSAGAATLNLQLDPDRGLVPAGKEQEVVVKIDVDSDTARKPDRFARLRRGAKRGRFAYSR